MTATEQGVITILKSAITGESYPLPEGFDLEKAYDLMKAHSVLALGYVGAAQCGVSLALPKMQQLMQDYGKSIWAGERQMLLVQQLYKAFDDAGVDYMPVKGCNLKMLYPEPGLRSMGDADILIRLDQYDRIVPIMEKLGYEKGVESDHELVWRQKFLMVELHKRLIPSYNKDYFRYYGDGWRLANRAEGTHWYMTDEDQFIYVFTHFAKHYRDGGIGCRHVLDLWLCLRSYPDMDMAYIHRELEKLQLDAFYRNMRQLIAVWFESAPADDRTNLMSTYILGSGSWGSGENHMLSSVARQTGTEGSVKEGRIHWVVATLFPSRSYLQLRYPVLKKWPVLLPVMWVRRGADAFFHRRSNASKKLKNFTGVSDDAIVQYRRDLAEVGLRFDFKEPEQTK